MQGSWLLVYTTLLTILHSDLLEGARGKVTDILNRSIDANCPEQPRCTTDVAYSSLPYIQDCTKYIYCMEDGNIEIFTCPLLQEFSPSEGYCMDATLAGCVEFSAPQVTIQQCPEQPHCTPEDIYSNLPYVTDCTKYIYCSPDGSELEINCSNGTEFSPTNGTCMDPELAECPECLEFVTNVSTTSTSQSLTTVIYCPEQPVCTPEDEYNNIPYVADCTKYIHCSASGPVIFDCEPGYEFSPTETKCMNSTVAHCPKCITTTESTTTTQAISFTTQVMTTPHCPEQINCTTVDDYTYIPYVANCSKYIFCEPTGGNPVLECKSGLHFSPTNGSCLPAEEAGCPQCIQTTTSSTISTTTINPQCIQQHCTAELMYSLLPLVTDCTKYIYCADEQGTEETRTCPNGEYFSPTQYKCTDPASAGCPECVP